jgi:Replicase family/Primase C terminal 1 (PriCT-1)
MKTKQAPALLGGARECALICSKLGELAVQEHLSNQARHATRRSGCASRWCVGIDVNAAAPERNGHQMGPGESTTNQPGVAADRGETIPYQIIAPERGVLSDPPLITQPTTGLRQRFPDLIPARPYCADVLGDGLKIRERKLALERRHIQLNGPATFTWMPHDIDHAGAYFAHRDANLPEPNFIAINPENGHGHSAVLLAMPVARHRAARIEPLHFYGAVERGIARRMGADRRYSGLITKNPVHPHWRVEWRREEPYTLPDLADWLFPEDMQPDFSVETTFGVGRNCIVFDELRLIAYREVRAFKSNGSLDTFQARLERVATDINTQFPNPLRPAEVRSIARSVSRWTWRRFSNEKFSELQRHRINIRWADHISAEMTKPWAAEGISRATWYRRQRDALTKTDWTTP